jgi:anti-sigma factor (TIGR02949 family)
MTPIERFTCEDTFRRLDDYVDRALSEAERRLVEQHLEECDVCAREYRFEISFINEVRVKLQRVRAPREMVERVLARLQSAS